MHDPLKDNMAYGYCLPSDVHSHSPTGTPELAFLRNTLYLVGQRMMTHGAWDLVLRALAVIWDARECEECLLGSRSSDLILNQLIKPDRRIFRLNQVR
jgi:hypothetical protein